MFTELDRIPGALVSLWLQDTRVLQGQTLPPAASMSWGPPGKSHELGTSRKKALVGCCWQVWWLVGAAGEVASCSGLLVPAVPRAQRQLDFGSSEPWPLTAHSPGPREGREKVACSRLNTTCSPGMFVNIVTNKHFARFLPGGRA